MRLYKIQCRHKQIIQIELCTLGRQYTPVFTREPQSTTTKNSWINNKNMGVQSWQVKSKETTTLYTIATDHSKNDIIKTTTSTQRSNNAMQKAGMVNFCNFFMSL